MMKYLKKITKDDKVPARKGLVFYYQGIGYTVVIKTIHGILAKRHKSYPDMPDHFEVLRGEIIENHGRNILITN